MSEIRHLDFSVAPLLHKIMNLANFLLLDLDNFLFNPNLKLSILILPKTVAPLLLYSLLIIVCNRLAKVFKIKISDTIILKKS